MKFLEFTPASEPVELFEKFVQDFIPDIFSALRNNSGLAINYDDPLSPMEMAELFERIIKTLNIANNFCKLKYGCAADSIKVEMRIRNGTFVWLRFVPLNKAKEPITKEKENISFVFPRDIEQISQLNKEGYNIIVLYSKNFPPKN